MTRQPELPEIPAKPKRRMLRPLKSVLYADVERLSDEVARKDIEIARLAAEVETLKAPAWRRLLRKRA